MKTILAPIDFSRVSERVVDAAIALAGKDDTRLVLVHIVPTPPLGSGDFAAANVGGIMVPDAERIAAGQLAELQRRLREKGIAVHAVHQIGPVVDGILDQAERLEADYIVMGSHGHGSLYELIVGSTTNGVLRRATCSVVIVPSNVATDVAPVAEEFSVATLV